MTKTFNQLILFFNLICCLINPVLAEEGFIPTAGVNLYYQSFDERPVIVVLHGGPGLDQSYLLPQMSKLAKQYRVIFYDQRGSGKSSPTTIDSKNINIDQFIKDLETLRQSLHLKNIILLGHSWGGLLAINYAIQHPKNVSALILLNSAPITSNGFKAFEQEYIKRITPIEKELTAIQTSEKFKQFDPTTTALFYRNVFSTYVANPKTINNLTLIFTPLSAKNSSQIEALFAPYFKKYDLRPNLQMLNLPTLVIAGDTDPIPIWAETEIANSLKKSEFVVIKNSGHFPYIEQPKILFSTINDFLEHLKPNALKENNP